MIQVTNLNLQYKDFTALKDINLDIKKGELVVLKGISGSGKSSLLALLGAFNHPTSGDIKIDNKSIVKLPDIYSSQVRNKYIGFVFQSFNLIDGLNVYDNVLAPLVLSKQKITKQKIIDAMILANIEHKQNDKIYNLSGGEKQRVAIARAIVNDPNIILADEPTANLDKDNSLAFIDILRKFKDLGKTVIIATHDSLFDNLDFVDQYINIQNGKIV
jgi:putative ABC transport system ATP-binding protein